MGTHTERRKKEHPLLGGLLIIIAILTIAYPAGMKTINGILLAGQADGAAMTDGQKTMFEQARDYNRRLAEQGQPVLGEAYDPWNGNGDGTPIREDDEKYANELDGKNGIMGSVSIPKIGVSLPIRHGTDQDALAKGAGHMYGTSLPVGGKDSHAVIAAHRGMVAAMMFTRLDEMREGDPFYLHVAGRTLAYRVDEISVVEPTDFSKLTIRPGEDRVTLMTCTPYGVNTQRLLVSGIRASMPDEAPYEKNAERSASQSWQQRAFLAACLTGAAVVALISVRSAWRQHHSIHAEPSIGA